MQIYLYVNSTNQDNLLCDFVICQALRKDNGLGFFKRSNQTKMTSIILTILFTIASAIFDGRLLKSGVRITNHTPRFLLRLLIIGLITLIFSKYKNDKLYNFLMYLLNSSIFYSLFDYLINAIWGKNILRVGTTAIIDRIWNRLGGSIPQLIFKIALVVVLSFFVYKKVKSKQPKIVQSSIGYAAFLPSDLTDIKKI